MEAMRLFPEESFKKRLGALCHLDEGVFLEEPPRVLLEGYTELKAISFSASLKGVSELLSGFQDVELLLGLEGGWSEADFYAKLVEEVEGLLPLLGKKRFSAFFLPESHAKLYLLRGPKGVRTVLGSLNLSVSAWDGSQSEIALFSDREEVYERWLAWYDKKPPWSVPLRASKSSSRISASDGRALGVDHQNRNGSSRFLMRGSRPGPSPSSGKRRGEGWRRTSCPWS
jgi:hypothetical protein